MNPFKSEAKKREELRREIIAGIESLGDMGVDEALKGNMITAGMSIDRLDQIRVKTKNKGMTFAEHEAEKQIDRIQTKMV